MFTAENMDTYFDMPLSEISYTFLINKTLIVYHTFVIEFTPFQSMSTIVFCHSYRCISDQSFFQ